MIEFTSPKLTVGFDENSGALLKVSAPVGAANIPSKLWQIGAANTAYCIADAKCFEYRMTDDALDLIWTADAFAVCVTVSKFEDGIRWNIRAELAEEGLEYIQFPILQGLHFENKDCLLIGWQNGHVIEDPVGSFLRDGKRIPFYIGRGDHAYVSEYPAGISYQFSTYYGEDFGFYLATEDEQACVKTYIFSYNEQCDAFDYSVKHYPENMGTVKEFCVPYPFVLELFKGDWSDAALRYRQWAIKQKWCKQKLTERNLPKNLKEVDFWRINHTNYALGTRTQEYFDTTLMLRDALQCHVGLHWYGWNMGQHDVNYPYYIGEERIAEGWPEKLTEWNKRFTDEGIVKIPYLNLRLWDGDSELWTEHNAAPHAILEPDGSVCIEPWNGRAQHPMCPTTEFWQHRCEEMAREYIMDCGFDGSYLDQVASFNAKLCFCKDHPHPIGGGTWWDRSYHRLLNRFRAVVGSDKILTTESCCETYVDFFDMFLVLDTNFQANGFNKICNKIASYSVPLFSMIYGDYALSYGSICVFKNDPIQFEYNFMRNILWGMLPSIDGAELQEMQSEKAPLLLDIMKRGVDFYRENKELIFYGRPTGPAVVENCGTLKIAWQLAANEPEVYETLDAVCAMRWLSADEKPYVLAYNFAEEAESVIIDGKSVSIPAKSFAKI